MKDVKKNKKKQQIQIPSYFGIQHLEMSFIVVLLSFFSLKKIFTFIIL